MPQVPYLWAFEAFFRVKYRACDQNQLFLNQNHKAVTNRFLNLRKVCENIP